MVSLSSLVWVVVLTVGRDIAAGVAILLEAGGLMTTANPPENEATVPIPDVKIGSRLYLAIRWVFLLVRGVLGLC
jgi:fructose-1,6-bisphosphatase/inositol monophosphatase family enzyme